MSNRLSRETSPYLLQHAGNPVDWHAWGAEALELARRTDRPILLSVGYSACHWCHVMAHESFEDPDTAATMNRYFVNIKVDREERPDIDQIYQTALQLILRRPGGWPLTMFLTPEGEPFFGGTYFPKHTRHDLPAFDELLHRIAQVWTGQRDQVLAQGAEIVRHLARTVPGADGQDAGGQDAGGRRDAVDDTARIAGCGLRDALMPTFDRTCGGFGGAPKFPQPSTLCALLRHAVDADDVEARDAVFTTLQRMAEGGLYDHLGGGFCRYSTDARWNIPHFEKMLYDNGPLLRLYAQAWQITKEPLFRRVCEETASWLMREMQSPEGGFYSSIDADSEGEEGRFYVWQRDDVAAHLDDDEAAAFIARYGLDAPPNFEGHAWHPFAAKPLSRVARELGIAEDTAAVRIASARAKLFAVRETRVRPGRDEKVLTSWNALAIDGMAFAARVFGERGWAASARAAFDFVGRALWRDGRLLATHKDGRSHLDAYLDDYAMLLGACIEVMQAGALRPEDLRFATSLADVLLGQFEDPAGGGFYFTGHDHEKLVLRPKPGYDSAMPSGNGTAALQLQRLGHLVGEPRYLDAAQRAMALFADDVRRVPHGLPTMVSAMREYASPPAVVVLGGPSGVLQQWRDALAPRWLPGATVLQLPPETEGLPQTLRMPVGTQPQAWVCRATQCLPPVDTLERLMSLLDEPPVGTATGDARPATGDGQRAATGKRDM